MARFPSTLLMTTGMLLCTATTAPAQFIATLSWQQQPYCNVLTINVTQGPGATFSLDGVDNQCAAATRASLVGIGFLNPNGTVGLGLTIVATPGGAAEHIDASIDPGTLSGSWRDSTGASGAFVLNGAAGGPPRPVPTGISALQYNIGQSRVLSAPGTDNLLAGIGAGVANAGADNTFVGAGAGADNTIGSRNTFIGSKARGGLPNLTNATAIGANAQVELNNTLVLGSVAGVNGATQSVRVGIGTPRPTSSGLEVVAPSDDGVTSTRYGGQGSVVVRRANGTLGTPVAVGANQILGQVVGAGHTGSGFSADQAGIQFVASQAFTSSARGTRLRLFTTPNGTASIIHRMVIEPDGKVGIGTSTPEDLLDVNGDIRVGTFGTNGCLLNNNGAGIVGTCSSDARFKRDVTPFAPTLDAVARLQPVHYYWREAAFPAKGFGSEQAYGLVAQDVATVLPELVSTDADGYEAVDYAKLPLLAIQAIKELKERSDALEAQLQHQLTAIDELRDALTDARAALRAMASATPGRR